tara:strand:+ start:849 stop:1112 length:264 start_codon:yes stop_codon:yes gene_type:complete
MRQEKADQRSGIGRVSLMTVLFVFLALRSGVDAFVLMGPPNAANEAPNAALWNYTDDLGSPKTMDRQIPRFYRWNTPILSTRLMRVS